MHRHPIAREEGMALLVAMAFISVALIVLGTLAVRVINEDKFVDRYTSYENCIMGIESGLVASQASLENGEDGMVGFAEEVDGEEIPGFDTEGVTPVHMDATADVEYVAYARAWHTDGIDNNGDGTVDGPEEIGFFTQYAAAREAGTAREVEAVIAGTDVNVWRNAIFAGAGQAGGLVNGNVSIHGSVHLLGNNLLTGDQAIAAMDLSGTSLVHNNYTGIPAALQSRVPALPTRSFNGETVQTLNAVLRVKRGLVGTSGNSEIGQPDVTGNTVKETMDATYVNDGWTGTSVVDDGDRGDPRHVYSDNGWDAKYNLGNRVSMPMLTDDWRDPGTGARRYDAARASNYTHEHYFDEVLVADPVNKTDGIYNGNMTITANANFYYNASRPTDTNPAHRLATDDYILYTSADRHMVVNGQISVRGNFKILCGNGANWRTINYTGRAAILAHGDVTLDTSLLTVNANGTTANSFPVNNCLGVMASGNMIVGSIAQLDLMGAFYAQGQIQTTKQTNVMGTFVSNFFNMGTNVPSIFQVPTLADNLPIGMIGAYPILCFAHVSWREI